MMDAMLRCGRDDRGSLTSAALGVLIVSLLAGFGAQLMSVASRHSAQARASADASRIADEASHHVRIVDCVAAFGDNESSPEIGDEVCGDIDHLNEATGVGITTYMTAAASILTVWVDYYEPSPPDSCDENSTQPPIPVRDLTVAWTPGRSTPQTADDATNQIRRIVRGRPLDPETSAWVTWSEALDADAPDHRVPYEFRTGEGVERLIQMTNGAGCAVIAVDVPGRLRRHCEESNNHEFHELKSGGNAVNRDLINKLQVSC